MAVNLPSLSQLGISSSFSSESSLSPSPSQSQSSGPTDSEPEPIFLENNIIAALTAQQPGPSLCTQISLSLRAKIRCLRHIALWPFCSIASEFQVPVSTVFSICNQPATPSTSRIGRPPAFTIEEQEQLLTHATASQANCRKCLPTIADELGIQISNRTLRRLFHHQGYHR